MTDEQRAIVRSLVDKYLPFFEANAFITSERENFFMQFVEQVEADKVINEDYVIDLERIGGRDALKDLDLIGRAGIDEIRALLTAALRSSEYVEAYNHPESIWREYAQAGTFMAILRRLDQLEKAARG